LLQQNPLHPFFFFLVLKGGAMYVVSVFTLSLMVLLLRFGPRITEDDELLPDEVDLEMMSPETIDQQFKVRREERKKNGAQKRNKKEKRKQRERERVQNNNSINLGRILKKSVSHPTHMNAFNYIFLSFFLINHCINIEIFPERDVECFLWLS
jgi:hypothetical protein